MGGGNAPDEGGVQSMDPVPDPDKARHRDLTFR